MAYEDHAMDDGKGPLKGWHVLLWFLGFFGVIFAVNGVFLYHAITSFPGEDVEKSYMQGLEYNRTLAQRQAQDELGWRAEIGLGGEEGANILIARISGQDGHALTGLVVEGSLKRAATTQDDLEIALDLAPDGTYEAAVALEPGVWHVDVIARSPTDPKPVFHATKTLIAP